MVGSYTITEKGVLRKHGIPKLGIHWNKEIRTGGKSVCTK
jgi:hypothetical protein